MRKLTTLGLALVAALAMSAFAASAASAEVFTQVGEGSITGKDTGGEGANVFTAFGSEVECDHEKTEYHASIVNNGATLTVEPTYVDCDSGPGTTDTVTMNGCDYNFHITKKDAEHHFSGTADLECPDGEVVEVHVYAATDEPHATSLCTLTIPEQTGIGGVTYTHETAPEDGLIIEGKIGPILATRHKGLACEEGEDKEAFLHTDITFPELTIE